VYVGVRVSARVKTYRCMCMLRLGLGLGLGLDGECVCCASATLLTTHHATRLAALSSPHHRHLFLQERGCLFWFLE